MKTLRTIHEFCIRDRPIYRPGWYIGQYLGFTDISVLVKTADIIGLNRSWQNAVIFLTHPDNLRKQAQRSKSRPLSYNNASRCGFTNSRKKASSGSFAMLEATTCRCCVRINSRYTSVSFHSTNIVWLVLKVQKSNRCLV